MKQADAMLESEADLWLERNRANMNKRDPVAEMIKATIIKPQRVLEIGCSNGWRLAGLRARYGCTVIGVEPGHQAAIEAAEHRVPVYRSTAEALPLGDASFDLVIYGFALYLTDPEDWFRIVMEGDRVLHHGGHLIVHDFAFPAHPFARRYAHREDILAYHVDFAGLWLAHPLYSLVHRKIFVKDEMITIMKKSSTDSIEVQA